MCILAILASGCGDELSAADPAKLPRSVDVRRLDGAKISDTACHLNSPRRVRGVGSGKSIVDLDCSPSEGRASGWVIVATVLTGEEPAEDAVRCHVDRSAEICVLRHGMITVATAADCEAYSCDAAEESRELLARVVERLAAQPEEPCRCGPFYSPERLEELTQRFSGTGRKELGTINVEVDSTIDVRPRWDTRVTFGRPPRALVDPVRYQPFINISRGTYRNVIVSNAVVSARRRWSLSIRPR